MIEGGHWFPTSWLRSRVIINLFCKILECNFGHTQTVQNLIPNWLTWPGVATLLSRPIRQAPSWTRALPFRLLVRLKSSLTSYLLYAELTVSPDTLCCEILFLVLRWPPRQALCSPGVSVVGLFVVAATRLASYLLLNYPCISTHNSTLLSLFFLTKY